jgi:hypothetical protein
VAPTIFAPQDYIMRKFIVAAVAVCASLSAFSQATKPTLINRAGDHFMLQLGSSNWSNVPDSIDSHLKGFNRSVNVYLMLDKPFKGNPKFSAAIGVGVGTSNMYFKKMLVNISSNQALLPFIKADSINHYKKYKLATAYLDIPFELRFTSDPENSKKGVKAAIGVKVGTMLNAHTKGRTLQNASNNNLNSATDKVSSKTYFNTTRLAATARLGYGLFSLYGTYNFTSVFKDGVAPDMKMYQIGLTISGL